MNSNCTTNKTWTVTLRSCLLPALSDLSTLMFRSASVPISLADHVFGTHYGGRYYNDLNAKGDFFFFLHLLFDFIRMSGSSQFTGS